MYNLFKRLTMINVAPQRKRTVSLIQFVKESTGALLLIIPITVFMSCASVSIEGIPAENLLYGTSFLTRDVKSCTGWGATEGKDNNVQKIDLIYNKNNMIIRGFVTTNNKMEIEENNTARFITNKTGDITHEFLIGSNSVYSWVRYQVYSITHFNLSSNSSGGTEKEERYDYKRIIKINGKEIIGTYNVIRKINCNTYGCGGYIDYELIDYNINGKNLSGRIKHYGNRSDKRVLNYDLKYGDINIRGNIKSKKGWGSKIFFYDFNFGNKKINGAYGSSEDIPDEPNIAFNAKNLTEEELLIFMLFVFNTADFSDYPMLL